MANIEIHWSGLVKVAEYSFLFGVGVVAVFTLGVLGVAQVEKASESQDGSGRVAGYALAGTAFAVSAAAVLYGLYLIIPQFH